MFTSKKTNLQVLYFSVGLLFVVIFTALLGLTNAHGADSDKSKSGSKLVNIYDRGVKTSVIANTPRVKDAVKEAGIVLNEHDRTEPSLDTEVSNVEYNVNVYRAHPVVVVDGKSKKSIISSYQTGDSIVKDAGINLRDEDVVQLERANAMSDGVGLKAVIKRATPFNLVFFGKTETVYTQSKTVGDFLDERNIKLGSDDKMSLAQGDAIIKDMTLKIWREGRQTITVEEDVDFPVEKIQDANRDPSYREVRQAGKKGRRTATYDIVVQDGEEVSRIEVASIMITQPVKQVEVVGAKFVYTGGPLTDAQINALGTCESGLTATRNSGNGFYGAFQFMYSTWKSVAPAPYNTSYPHEAPLDAQKQAVQNLVSRSNIFNQFPACARKMRANGIL